MTQRIARLMALGPPILDVPPQGFVLSDVTVVNPGLDWRPKQTLAVQGSEIVHISDRPAFNQAAVVDHRYAGAYVLPGLIDMHVHYPLDQPELAGLLFLAHGVTTVRDTGNFFRGIWKTRRRIVDGEFPGPHIFACGPMLDGAPAYWRWVVRDPYQARAAVARLAAHGSHFVKVMDNLSAETLAAIREAASSAGLPVIGHVPFSVSFLEARLDDVQHLFCVQPLPPPPFGVAEVFGSWRNLDHAAVDAIVRTSVEHQVAHTPTLVLWDRLSRFADPQQMRDPTLRLLPRYYREVVWTPEFNPQLGTLSAELLAIIGEAVVEMKKLVGHLHASGVRIHAGTDTAFNPFVVPGASLHEEFRHLVDAGLSPEEVWVAATRNSGESLGDFGLGTLTEGAPADLLVFREDPTRDRAALSTLEAVATQGRLYPKTVLDDALARHQAFFESSFYETESVAICHTLGTIKLGTGH